MFLLFVYPKDLSSNRVNGHSPSLEMVSIRAPSPPPILPPSLLVEEEEGEEKEIVGRSPTPILEGVCLHLPRGRLVLDVCYILKNNLLCFVPKKLIMITVGMLLFYISSSLSDPAFPRALVVVFSPRIA